LKEYQAEIYNKGEEGGGGIEQKFHRSRIIGQSKKRFSPQRRRGAKENPR
jgi:hypothetical protein